MMTTNRPGAEMPDSAFLQVLAEGGMTDVSPRGIEVQLDDGVRWFLPEGGLTFQHFRSLSPLIEDHYSSADFAQAILINALRHEKNPGDARDAVRGVGGETDLADALRGDGYELLVERARRKILEIELGRMEIKNPANTGNTPPGGDGPTASTPPSPRSHEPYGGRLTCDRATKTVRLDGSTFVIEDASAFSIFEMLFKANGDIVNRRQLQVLPGCKGRVDRIIKNEIRERQDQISEIIQSKPGPAGGYWFTLPAPGKAVHD